MAGTDAKITVTGTFITPTDTADTGKCTFTPILDDEIINGNISVKESVQASIQNGVLSQQLVARPGGYSFALTMDGNASLTLSGTIRGDVNVNLNSVLGTTGFTPVTGRVKTSKTITTNTYTLVLDDYNFDQLFLSGAGVGGIIQVTVPLDVTNTAGNPPTGAFTQLIVLSTAQLAVGGPGAGNTGGSSGGVFVFGSNGYLSTSQFAKIDVERIGSNSYIVDAHGGGTSSSGVGFTFRGAWSSATTYAKGDLVSFSNGSYASIAGGNLNHTPTAGASNSFWNLIAGQGATGAPTLPAFDVPGVLTTGTGPLFLPIPATLTIVAVRAYAGTAPTGASIICDVNKNGTTIFTTQANRPTITAGNHDSGNKTPDVTSLASGDRLSVDVDQVGSSVAGSDLVVVLEVQ